MPNDDPAQEWLPEALGRLEARPACGYHPGQPPDAEPTALAALALLRHQRHAEAALQWLADAQHSDGRVATAASHDAPGWPTALAVLAWQASGAWPSLQARGVDWLLAARGRPEPNSRQMGHDMTLVAWSWVEHTHSWIEPTAMAVLALKAAGHSDHARVREAVRLLWDRQLPDGGFNYGNTQVLGQWLRPHLAPTGLALAALADEPEARPRLHRSCEYLERELSGDTPAVSLSYALIGLGACDRSPRGAARWLASADARQQELGARSPWAAALLCLAAAPRPALSGASA